LRLVRGAIRIDGKFAGDPEIGDAVAARTALLGNDIAVEHRHGLALLVVANDHAFHGFEFLEHDPEKACPGLDPGWKPVFRKDHAPPKKSRTVSPAG
jgi:hypothetical protein